MPNRDANFHDLHRSQTEQFDRLSLARRLHETLAQSLAVIGYDLDALIGDDELKPSQRAELRSIRLQVMSVTKSFRDEIYRARRLSRSELSGEIRSILEPINSTIDLTYPRLSDEHENLLNEVIIEIARNTRKHSSASSFYLNYEFTDSGFLLFIGDDGLGSIALKRDSFGLLGMNEVLKVISRDYQCRSDETGTHFRIRFPLESSR